MKITLGIPTNVDWARIQNLEYSLLNNTADPTNVTIIFLDNCNTFGHDMSEWYYTFNRKYRGNSILISLPKRVGLTTAWQECTKASATDWTILANDDLYYMPAWDTTFRDLVKAQPNFGCYLLCHPYNWSGFAVNQAFIEEFPWRTEFPAGYHEDNDLYLRVATARGLTSKHDIYTKGIYCLPYNTNEKQYCFQHLDHTETQRSIHYTRWDDAANLAIFNKYWKQVHPADPGAIENKNGSFYIAQ